MQNAQLAAAISLPSVERYSVRQRLLSASVSLAMSGSAATTAALANTPAPAFVPTPQATPVHAFASAGHTAASHSGFSAMGAGSVSALTHASVFSPMGLPAASSLHPVSSFNQATHAVHSSHPVFATNSAAHPAPASVNGKTDLNLTSVNPIFQAGGLAGFHNITIVVGGKVQQVTVDSKLTAAELVAAQQVLSGGKQAIKVNGSGAATGGYFDLSSSTVSALDGAVGGQVGSLVISHGVKAIDSLSSFDLTGSLINMGKIVMASPGAGQSVDTINADNIYNRAGGVISSTAASGVGIGLDAANIFSNSGTISSGSTLNISAPTVINAADANPTGIVHAQPTLSAAQNVNITTQSLTNSGLISSQAANVNVGNGGGNDNIVVNGDGGTIQATKGNINFNAAGYNGSGNITLNGGDYLSKQVNLNAGAGDINANVGTVTGQVNGAAANSHVMAATDDLNLGTICVSGDPTYFNTKGDITITGALTGDPDLAIVASGNIIANGGSLDTSAATLSKAGPVTVNGGNITLIAGADFTTTPVATGSGTTLPADADKTTTLNMSGKGSKTGGYIDLSGSFYTGKKDAPITAFTSSGIANGASGDITIIAYTGTGKFSGGIFATPNGGPQTGLVTVNAAGGIKNGDITVIGGGAFYVFANGLEGANVTVSAGMPTSPAYTITDGKLSSTANFSVLPNTASATTLFANAITATGSISLNTAGTIQQQGTYSAGGDISLVSTKGIIETFGNVVATGKISYSAGGAIEANGIISNDSITVTSPGQVLLGLVNAAGAGGAGVGAVGSGNGIGGGNGGSITITGGSVDAQLIDTSGAGGGGGSSAAGITGDGGGGGNGGNISLTSTTGNIEVHYYVNASGGGGGGGAGANQGSATVGTGGAGGQAGIVTITAKGSYIGDQAFGYSVLDFDGAAGGNGGVFAGVAGGGGGGGTGFGGGGGGGAAGIVGVGNTGAGAVGGGGAGTFVVGSGAGGAGTVAATTVAFGGGGGSARASSSSFGTPGVASTVTTGGAVLGAQGMVIMNSAQVSGGNGGGASTTLGGLAGGANGSGQGGANGLVTTDGRGLAGGNTTTATGAGKVYLTVGNVTGKANAPVLVDTPEYFLVGTTKSASMYLSCGGDTLTLESAQFVSGSTLNLSETHNTLIVAGPVTGASNVVLDGWQGVQVNSSITADKSITIIAGQTPFGTGVNTQQFGGNITTSGVTSIISAPTVSLTAYEEVTSGGVTNLGGNVTAHVSGVTSLAVNGVGNGSAVLTNVGIQIDTLAGKTTTFTSGSASGGFGITADGFGVVTSSKAIAAKNVIINADATIGSASKPLLTNASGSITVNGNSPNAVFIKDANVNALTVSGSGVAGESVTITSAAKTLTVADFDFTNVNISDTYATAGQAASVILGSLASDKIGDGSGTVIIASSAGNIVAGPVGSIVQGDSISLTSKTGNIGASGAAGAIVTEGETLSLSAAKGSVYVSNTSSTATIEAATALNTFNFTNSGFIAVNTNIGSASTAAVSLTSGDGIADNGTFYVTAKDVTLNSFEIGDSNTTFLTKASGTLNITATGTGRSNITQNGKATLNSATGAAGGTLRFTDVSPLAITGLVDFGTVSITAPSVTLVAGTGGSASGIITGADIDINSPLVNVGVAGGITATNSATFYSPTSLVITGLQNSITPGNSLTLGGSENGKTTSAITLGDAKTGANNPLASALSGGVSKLEVYTTGNFTSSATSLQTGPEGGQGGSAGVINFGAKAIVVEGTAPVGPFTFVANGNPLSNGGDVEIGFSGTQNVTFGNAAGQFQISNVGSADSGYVYVSSGGTLTVNDSGITGASGNLTLVGGKGLSVNSADLLSSGHDFITLSSGAKTAFAINAGGTAVANGTVGAVNAGTVNINAAGPITLTSGAIDAVSLEMGNSSGVLSITGPVGSVTSTAVLYLNGSAGVTLGDAKTGVGNPFDETFIHGVGDLTVNAGKGNFTSNLTDFTLNAASGNQLVINAANIVSTGSTPVTHLTFAVGSTQFDSIEINLTGTQTVTVGSMDGTTKAPTYQLSNSAINGQEDITVGGILIVADKAGLSYNDNSEVTLSGGKGLQVVAPNQFGTVSSQLELTLSSGSASPLVIGANTGTNYVAGNINAGSLEVTGKGGVTINADASVTVTNGGNSIIFDTSKFTNNGTLSDLTSGATFAINGAAIAITNSSAANYTNIANFNVTGNSVNFGNLFSQPNLLGSLNSLNVQVTGVVTVNAPTITANSVSITGASIAYKGTTAPELTIAATNVLLATGAPIIIGTAKGAINLSAPTLSGLNLDSVGAVTLNESLTMAPGTSFSVTGSSIAVNSSFNGAASGIGFFTAGTKGTVTTANGATINGTELIFSGGSATAPKAALSINASQVQFSNGGAWNVVNSHDGSSINTASNIASLNYSGNGNVIVDGVSSSTGPISIAAIDGNLNVAAGSTISSGKGNINLIVTPATADTNALQLNVGNDAQILAANGSIVLLNASFNNVSTIDIGQLVDIHASGTAAGVGQVSIVMGFVPTASTLLPGVVPVGVQVVGSGGASVTLGGPDNANGTVVANGFGILLNADGRNLVINDNGVHTAITLSSGDRITADPPVVFGASSQASSGHSIIAPAVISAVSASPAVVSSSLSSAVLGLATANQQSTISAPALLNQSAINATGNISGTASGAVSDSSGTSALRGEVSNHALRQLQNGSLFIAPDVDTVVETSGGAVKVSAGAVALLIAFNGGVAVYNMHDVKRNSVVVEQFGHKVALAPGRSVVLTNRAVRFFEEANPAEFVGYRRVQAKAFEDGVKSFHAEFDVRTMLQGVTPLKDMLASRDSHDKQVTREMLKTTAILMSSNDATPYQLMVAPRLTAMGFASDNNPSH